MNERLSLNRLSWNMGRYVQRLESEEHGLE